MIVARLESSTDDLPLLILRFLAKSSRDGQKAFLHDGAFAVLLLLNSTARNALSSSWTTTRFGSFQVLKPVSSLREILSYNYMLALST